MERQLFRAGRREAGTLGLTIPVVRLFRDDRRALFQPTVQKALWCWAWSILLAVVLVGFIHGRNRSRSHMHDNLEQHRFSKFLSAANLQRVRRQVKALKLCELALPNQTAKRQPRQPRFRKPSFRDVMRIETIVSGRTLGLKTYVTSEEFVRQVRDERKEPQANPARLARNVAGSNAHASAKEREARHASMECSAMQPARSSESGPPTSILARSHGGFDFVDLVGSSATRFI